MRMTPPGNRWRLRLFHISSALDGSRTRMAQSGVRRLLRQARAMDSVEVYGSRWASPSSKRLHGRSRVRGWVRLPYASAP